MTVSFSTRAPNSDYLGFAASPEAIIAAAKKAEEVGFDAIFVNDHIVVGDDARSAPWTNVYDPFVAMSFIAAHTSRIGVGVSVLIMPYRNPVATAKALATLDLMSGGRLTIGVGAGWNEAEFAALGVPFHERGARTNEYLRLWQSCWGPGRVSFAGKFFAFSDMHVSPKPLQQPHPPLWIGGFSDAALRRAARFAAVWQPTPLPIDQLVGCQAALRKACEDIGRAPIPTRMSFRVEFSTVTGNAPPAGRERPSGHGTPAEVAQDLLRYRKAAGLGAFQINFHGNRDLGQLLQSMECFMREVAPIVAPDA
ncbi:MAG: TIGR03619 family F420-dependent LLM class oxidoreductase [Alphaproteobacteria bacterium]|nr:TIGR03619 family F420-dependent LLM class oxidoreductase [Alphaproteobacteria bacterium]